MPTTETSPSPGLDVNINNLILLPYPVRVDNKIPPKVAARDARMVGPQANLLPDGKLVQVNALAALSPPSQDAMLLREPPDDPPLVVLDVALGQRHGLPGRVRPPPRRHDRHARVGLAELPAQREAAGAAQRLGRAPIAAARVDAADLGQDRQGHVAPRQRRPGHRVRRQLLHVQQRVHARVDLGDVALVLHVLQQRAQLQHRGHQLLRRGRVVVVVVAAGASHPGLARHLLHLAAEQVLHRQRRRRRSRRQHERLQLLAARRRRRRRPRLDDRVGTLQQRADLSGHHGDGGGPAVAGVRVAGVRVQATQDDGAGVVRPQRGLDHGGKRGALELHARPPAAHVDLEVGVRGEVGTGGSRKLLQPLELRRVVDQDGDAAAAQLPAHGRQARQLARRQRQAVQDADGPPARAVLAQQREEELGLLQGRDDDARGPVVADLQARHLGRLVRLDVRAPLQAQVPHARQHAAAVAADRGHVQHRRRRGERRERLPYVLGHEGVAGRGGVETGWWWLGHVRDEGLGWSQ
ncbi:hypothetical protein PpBr36_00053 [Pyricularia pennisetigena]|uniref:hypothetical protein n=1 Tax=Pyricularia pennisetigena TaxID=1578925 RepID=UPI001153181D|nr:hypothetical protein PpBr36_00053 [Pyricularia pennisetigena]TLS28147.1 hypothetical protein PpBr36_00053 [Pyricularia pennisetigena]